MISFVLLGLTSCKDYDELLAKGVDFNGKIILARYGYNFRGLKVGASPVFSASEANDYPKIKIAQELGAIGVLIYSDPRDDGYVTVENGYLPYPQGPARNPTSVQRGSVQFISIYPGDPATPGYPAYEDAPRTEASNIPKIPSLPISWANAQVLLKEFEDTATDGTRLDGRQLSGKASKRSVQLVNHGECRLQITCYT